MICRNLALSLIISSFLSSAVLASSGKSSRHWAARVLRLCQLSFVRAVWGRYHEEEAWPPRSNAEPLVLVGAKLPPLPEGIASPTALPPEELQWVIPSSPSEAVPIVDQVLRTVLSYVLHHKKYTYVPIETGSNADRTLNEIAKGFRRSVENACVDDSPQSHEIVFINNFFGGEYHLYISMRRDPLTRELILEVTRPDAPMAAIAHEISRNVIGHAPRFVPQTFRFYERIPRRPRQAIEDFADGLARFAKIVRAENTSCVAGEVISAMKLQLRRVVMVDFLRHLEGQLGAPSGIDSPRRVVTDAIDKVHRFPTIPLEDFADAKRLLAKQAGWDSHRRKVNSALDVVLARYVGHKSAMKEEVEVILGLENGYQLAFKFPLTFAYHVEKDGSISITKTETSFFSPYPMIPVTHLAEMFEFQYGLSKEDPNLEQMQELERLVAYWLEWAFTHES